MIFVHLYNDYSGSPRVLTSVVDAWVDDGWPAQLFFGAVGDGLLNQVRVTKSTYFYARSDSRLLQLLYYVGSQLSLFIKLSFSSAARKDKTIYINSLMPFGAAIYGFLFKKTVIYHLHEVSLSPKLLFKLLLLISDLTADVQIYVSHYHKNAVASRCKNKQVIYNAVDRRIWRHGKAFLPRAPDKEFVVLMPASLRSYKGVDLFSSLARLDGKKMSNLRPNRSDTRQKIRWVLLLNDTHDEVLKFKQKHQDIKNLEIFAGTADPTRFYMQAHLVVNLSKPDQWVETFGLTIVEAFLFGLPVIAPPIGGPSELVEESVDGFLINPYDCSAVLKRIYLLANSKQLYNRTSSAAKRKAPQFSPDIFKQRILSLLLQYS